MASRTLFRSQRGTLCPEVDAINEAGGVAYAFSPSDAQALPDLVRQYEAFRKGETSEVAAVPFEMLTSLELGADVWTAISRHAGWHMTRMNLNTFARHGMFVIDWNGDGRDELLTASNQGVHLFTAQGHAPRMQWSRTRLAAGHVGEPPHCGASEVCVGQVKNGPRFITTIEPWHGNEVVVYTKPPGDLNGSASWQRTVIDDTLRAGHALCCTDLDGDGSDEIIAGYRGGGTSLYGYRQTPGGTERWKRFVIDAGGIAAQGCVAADVDGDGRTDLVATGGTTHNVRLYINETRPRHP